MSRDGHSPAKLMRVSQDRCGQGRGLQSSALEKEFVGMNRTLLSLTAAAAFCAAAPAGAQTVLTTSTWVPQGHAITLAHSRLEKLYRCRRAPGWKLPPNIRRHRPYIKAALVAI